MKYFLSLLILSSIFFTNNHVYAQIPESERAALIEFYNSTGGDTWTHNTNWKGAVGSEGTWYGVTLDESGTNIESLLLSDNQLSGSIPAEIGNFANLKNLYLNGNQLSGSIPAEIGNLTNLQQLFLNHNQFSSSIPAEIGNLTNLQRLYLYNNQFSGSIPTEIGNLTNLQYLFLNGNQLLGSIPAEIGNLTNLQFLSFSGNQLTGNIPYELINLTSLVLVLPSTYTSFGYNALSCDNETLRAFLITKDADWESTQTIKPENLTVVNTTFETIEISWEPIKYILGPGGYEIYYSTTSDGSYELFAITSDKTINSSTITGLIPDTNYYIKVRTVSLSSENHPADIYSDYTEQISAITTLSADAATVNFSAGENGKIEGIKSQTVAKGNNCTSVTAVADTNYHFTEWTGDHTGTENPLILENITENMTVTANFEINTNAYIVSFTTADANGGITGTFQTVVYDGDCTPVTAVAAPNYHFTEWTGDYAGIENPLTLEAITKNMTVTANFAINTYNVTFRAETNGHIDGTTSQTLEHNSDCTEVRAVPIKGYHFAEWTGGYTGTENPLTLIGITEDKAVIANFELNIDTDGNTDTGSGGNGKANCFIDTLSN